MSGAGWLLVSFVLDTDVSDLPPLQDREDEIHTIQSFKDFACSDCINVNKPMQVQVVGSFVRAFLVRLPSLILYRFVL